jgi:hypothetical protein
MRAIEYEIGVFESFMDMVHGELFKQTITEIYIPDEDIFINERGYVVCVPVNTADRLKHAINKREIEIDWKIPRTLKDYLEYEGYKNEVVKKLFELEEEELND